MKRHTRRSTTAPSILVLGVGAFAHSTGQILKDAGARVSTYLTRNYGLGYPYLQVRGPCGPIQLASPLDCDVWWNEVTADTSGSLISTGHRIADVIAFGTALETAISNTYRNIRKIRCLGSYYRRDIGQSLWPPGNS